MNKTLEQDQKIWEAITRFVCGRDKGGLNYYKNDLIEGFKVTYQQSLPSKPVGDVEEMAKEYAEGMMGLGKYSDRWHHADKMTYNLIIRSVKYGATTTLKTPHSIDVLQITEGYSKGMAEYFMQHNYRLMYELWEQFINQLKSGYAAATECKKCKETEYLITNEPTNFLLVNALRLLDSDGMKALADSLYERVPAAPQKGMEELREYADTVSMMEFMDDPGAVVSKLLTLIYNLNQPSESPSPSEAGDGWISVEDGLPEVDTPVYVRTEYKSSGKPMVDFFTAYMDEYGDTIICPHDESYGWQFNDCVTHWHPCIPAPPIQK